MGAKPCGPIQVLNSLVQKAILEIYVMSQSQKRRTAYFKEQRHGCIRIVVANGGGVVQGCAFRLQALPHKQLRLAKQFENNGV